MPRESGKGLLQISNFYKFPKILGGYHRKQKSKKKRGFLPSDALLIVVVGESEKEFTLTSDA
jgi:hypothetical protein